MTKKEITFLKVFLVIVLLLGVGIGGYWYFFFDGAVESFGGERIIFSTSQMDRISLDYYKGMTKAEWLKSGLKQSEVAYCLIMDGDVVVDMPVASTINASNKHILYYNCPDAIGNLHTHPSGYPFPSQEDWDGFYNDTEKIMCVYGVWMTCWTIDDGKRDELKIQITG